MNYEDRINTYHFVSYKIDHLKIRYTYNSHRNFIFYNRFLKIEEEFRKTKEKNN